MKTYNRRTCYVCGCDTSTAGAAWAAHMKKHVREGRAVEVKRNYGKRYGVEITYEKVKSPNAAGEPQPNCDSPKP